MTTDQSGHGSPRGAIERLLYAFGYGAAYLLFLGAHSPKAVVTRLRVAYRIVGVRIVETPRVDGVERTIFLCPYRNLASGRYGEAWLCHRKLDRVDDGKANEPVRAVMIDLELGEAGLGLIRQAKQHAGAPAVIAFGSHVAKEVLDAARNAGADQVLPRSAFTTKLPA
ncbi:MAG: hypothetical protein ACOC8O_02255, partial [Natronomonas sp.]